MNNHEQERLCILSLKQTKYIDIWNMQKQLVQLRYEEKIPNCLIITEHEPVITMGRNSSKTDLLVSRAELKKQKIEICQIERNGGIAYHGQGQLMAYPIIDLSARGKDLHNYFKDLESIIISVLKDMNLMANTRKTMTGVWVKNHLIAAIGVAVFRWISYHGLTINVNNNFDYVNLINPWGIEGFPNGSISSMLGTKTDMGTVREILIDNFINQFGYKPEIVKDIKEIIGKQVTV
ncbi:MAG: lipoyl(octanoyl) transferase LipB [candidate division Zixibacteria bacterium]|nr:lipoyl(octanoyl) transferase LipB [candidate division Zixibacteria bacterium]